jgi:hypothetical protein
MFGPSPTAVDPAHHPSPTPSLPFCLPPSFTSTTLVRRDAIPSGTAPGANTLDLDFVERVLDLRTSRLEAAAVAAQELAAQQDRVKKEVRGTGSCCVVAVMWCGFEEEVRGSGCVPCYAVWCGFKEEESAGQWLCAMLCCVVWF